MPNPKLVEIFAMNKRNLIILAGVILLIMVLAFWLRNSNPSASSASSSSASIATPAGPTPAKTPAVALPTTKPVAASEAPPADTASTTPASIGAKPNAAAKNTLRQLGQSLISYRAGEISNGWPPIDNVSSVHGVALALSRTTTLTDASVYFVPGDPRAPASLPTSVTDPAFANATLSVEIAVQFPPDTSPTTTPLAWSRGLREDGTWAPDSPFGGKGGYILYLDGHVEWVDKFNPNGVALLISGSHDPTTNIREALPPGAVILSAEPKGQGH